MEVYENGGYVYYVIMFIDVLKIFCDIMKEIEVLGFEKIWDV